MSNRKVIELEELAASIKSRIRELEKHTEKNARELAEFDERMAAVESRLKRFGADLAKHNERAGSSAGGYGSAGSIQAAPGGSATSQERRSNPGTGFFGTTDKQLARSGRPSADSATSVYNGQIVPLGQQQLAIIKKIAEDAGERAYDKIASEINVKVLPQIRTAMAKVDYLAQDTDAMIDDYRSAVNAQSDDGIEITDHVKTFFG